MVISSPWTGRETRGPGRRDDRNPGSAHPGLLRIVRVPVPERPELLDVSVASELLAEAVHLRPQALHLAAHPLHHFLDLAAALGAEVGAGRPAGAGSTRLRTRA